MVVNPFQKPSTPTTPPTGGVKNPFATPTTTTPSNTSQPKSPNSVQAPAGIPQTATQGSLGGGYGASNIKDTSGKPLLTYENNTAKSSQLLSDRVAPSFDPTVAQKLTPDMLQNGRISEDVSSKIKSSLGGNSSQELDHQIALELSGSNNNSNLKLEPNIAGTHNTATDPLENMLAKKVVSGNISLIDAHRQLAKAKGFTLPEDGGKVPTFDKFPVSTTMSAKDKAGAVALNFFPSTLQTLSELQLDPLNLKGSPMNYFKDFGKSIGENLISEAQNIARVFTGKTGAEKTGAALSSIAGGIGVVFSPVTALFSAAKDIPVLGSLSRLLTLPLSAMGETGQLEAKALVDKLPISSDAKDQISKGYGDILATANMFAAGGISEEMMKEKLTPKYGPTDAATIVNKAKDLADGKDIVPKQTLTDIATKPEEAPKPVAQEQKAVENNGMKEKNNPIPKELQPLAEEARKYKSAEEFVKAQEPVYHGSPRPLKSFSNKKGGVFFTSSMEDASGFGGSPDNVYEGYLNFKNPLVVDAKGAKWNELESPYGKSTQEVISNAQKEGHDGVVFKNIVDNAMDTADEEGQNNQTTVSYAFKPKDQFLNESQLTDFYNQATKGEISVPEAKNQTKPVESEIIKKSPKSIPSGGMRPIEGTGKVKVRGLSEGVEAKAIASTPSKLPSFAPEETRKLEQAQVASKLTDVFGELPTYKQMDVADQGAKAIDLFQKDPESAKQIAYGAKAPPKGLTPEAVYIAVEQDAIERGDFQTLKELANSRLTTEATTMGQRIRMLAERNPESPTDAIRQAQEARVKSVQEKLGKPVEEAKQEMIKKDRVTLDAALKKTKSKVTLDEFINSITC